MLLTLKMKAQYINIIIYKLFLTKNATNLPNSFTPYMFLTQKVT